ncbi:MAG: hypothetical protein CVV47_07490 [Spirochaetae bacterium HGW-Spirochaetae-3]|nr:MAG: hypothetical protein CVV47_07490 [Spirochaetae bacterium HGW-Spirochaetae-3]
MLSSLSVAAMAEPIQLAGQPADGPMGIGIFLGQPTGVTFEMDLSKATWLDFKAAWDLAAGQGGYSIMLQGNYEIAFPGMIAIETALFTPFVGAGALVQLYDGGANFGVRVPGGVSYRFTNVPLELFLEAGLDIYLLPGFTLDMSGGLGARYRF